MVLSTRYLQVSQHHRVSVSNFSKYRDTLIYISSINPALFITIRWPTFGQQCKIKYHTCFGMMQQDYVYYGKIMLFFTSLKCNVSYKIVNQMNLHVIDTKLPEIVLLISNKNTWIGQSLCKIGRTTAADCTWLRRVGKHHPGLLFRPVFWSSCKHCDERCWPTTGEKPASCPTWQHRPHRTSTHTTHQLDQWQASSRPPVLPNNTGHTHRQLTPHTS